MYTPSHIANYMLDRADDEGRIRRVKRWGCYTAFILFVLLALGLLAVVFVLLWAWVDHVIENDLVPGIISAIMSFIFGAAFTIAVEFLWRVGSGKEKS